MPGIVPIVFETREEVQRVRNERGMVRIDEFLAAYRFTVIREMGLDPADYIPRSDVIEGKFLEADVEECLEG